MAVAVVDPEPGPGGVVGGGRDARPGERGPLRRGAAPGPGPGSAAGWPAFAAELERGGRSTHRLPHHGDPRGGGRRRGPGLGRRALRLPARPRARRASGSRVAAAAAARARASPPACAAPSGRPATTRSTTACSWARCSTPPPAAGRRRAPRTGPTPSNARRRSVSGVRLAGGDTVLAPAPSCWPPAAGRRSSTGCPPAPVPPVRPVKGQILRLRPRRARPGAHPDRARPRPGLVGLPRAPRRTAPSWWAPPSRNGASTPTVTAGAVYELLRDAHRVVPGITEMVLGETSAGLRPGSPDNAPIVGRPRSPASTAWCVATATTARGSCWPR